MFAALALGAPLQLAFAQGLFFNPSGVRFGRGLMAKEFVSQNGKFRVAIEQTNPGALNADRVQLTAIVRSAESSSGVPLWTSQFEGVPAQYLRATDVLVSDAGDFFVAITDYNDGLTLVRKDSTIRLLNRAISPSFFLSAPETLAAIDNWQGETIVRWWVRDDEVWEAVRARDGGKIIVTPEAAARFNETTRREIIAKLEAAERELLREKITRISAPLAGLASPATTNDLRGSLREIHYEFLTTLRRPEDRHWIENLIEPGAWHELWRDWDPQEDPFYFVNTDIASQRADWLLAVWDQKIKKQNQAPRMRSFSQWPRHDLPRYTLGQLSGSIRFSTPLNLVPAPYTRSVGPVNLYGSVLRILLFRAEDVGRVDAKPEIEFDNAIPTTPPTRGRSDAALHDVVDEVRFALTTVRPGKYSLKAIWDKRAPYLATNIAGPGDYESTWFAPFEIKPACNLSNIVLMCTNRAAGGETYYATDDWLARGWKVTGEFARYTFMPDSLGRQDLFSRSATLWITRTNVAPNTNCVQIQRIGLRSYKMMRNTFLSYPDSLIVEFRRLARDGRTLSRPSEDIAIIDEHGCKYAISYMDSTARTIQYVFDCFPRAAKTWRIVGLTGPKADSSPAFDYSVTNLVQTPRHELPASELPLDLNLDRVRLKIISVDREYREPNIESSLFGGSESAENWRIQEYTVADAHGNFINPKQICREEKSFRVLGVVGRREPQLVTVPFEFAVAREEPKK
jgi:hypothetical protein